MKKPIIALMLVLVLALTACSGSAASTQQAGSNQTTTTSPGGELPLASKLVIGSFKLEGTNKSITADQAAQLLPLWEVYTQLTTSDTAAQEEITALTQQIQDTMTTDQVTAINAMNLTQQDVFATMQEQGIQLNSNRQQGSSSQQNGNNNFGPPGGGGGEFFTRPEGGNNSGQGGGAGGFGGGGQGINPEQIATAQARRAQNGGGGNFQFNSTPSQLIEALIKLLQERATPSS